VLILAAMAGIAALACGPERARAQDSARLLTRGGAPDSAEEPAGGPAPLRLVATLDFPVGGAELTAEHRDALDDLARRFPPAAWLYTFEGDHDTRPFRVSALSRAASDRLNERLAETRWQNVAAHLGVPPLGFVRSTGATEVRVYVEPRPAGAAERVAEPAAEALADSIARLRGEIETLRRQLADRARIAVAVAPPAPAETVLAVARIEAMHVRTDKWVDRRWWESGAGVELGLLRVQPERPGRPTGATLIVGNGTFAYHPLEVTTRLDVLRLGWSRLGVTPALRWYDWSLRIHYGDDRQARGTFFSGSDPNYLFGLDLDARPWEGAVLRAAWAGMGARVHAASRALASYDHFVLRFGQRLVSGWGVEAQAVFDERFEKSLAYAGAWLAHGWPMRIGEFSARVGFVEQLDALAATAPLPQRREDPVSTVSFGVAWTRSRRFAGR
jgi:hypothetical protein